MEQEGLGRRGPPHLHHPRGPRGRRAGHAARPARARTRSTGSARCCASSTATDVRYVSTRGQAPAVGFADVLLAGLAPDGGLYVPEAVAGHRRAPAVERPTPTSPSTSWARSSRPASAATSCGAGRARPTPTFDHPDVCPLRASSATGCGCSSCSTARRWPSRTWPSSSSAGCSTTSSSARGERVTIVGATSGDTGSAAIEACRGRDTLDIVVLHPAGRVSEVQRRQMTTVDAPNVHNVADRGHLRRLPGPGEGAVRRRRLPGRAPAVGDELDQLGPGDGPGRLLRHRGRRRSRPATARSSFAVPTGNFGNIFAGWVRQAMGVPDRAAARRQQRQRHPHPLVRHRGAREPRRSCPRSAPRMDIQVSSNLERLLFELLGRDGAATAELMTRFRRGSVRSRHRATPTLRCRAGGRRRDPAGDRRRVRGPTATWSTPTPRSASRPPAACGAPRTAGRLPGHRAPGQVPRRGRGGHRRSARRCPTAWPTCSTGPSATTCSATTSTR